METEASVRRRALRWCRDLAGWFPAIRPGAEALTVAEDIAAALGPNDGTVSLADIRRVCWFIDDAARRSLVNWFGAEHGDQWASVCSDAGDVGALESALVEGAARAAILERRLPPELRLAHLETGEAPHETSCDVLTVTLLPETVWSIVEADRAEQAIAASSGPLWAEALPNAACELRSDDHVERVQVLARSLSRQLPAPGYPQATKLLARAYSDAARDRNVALQVADQLLGIYLVQRSSYSTSSN